MIVSEDVVPSSFPAYTDFPLIALLWIAALRIALSWSAPQTPTIAAPLIAPPPALCVLASQKKGKKETQPRA